jgi:hypothetical protein
MGNPSDTIEEGKRQTENRQKGPADDPTHSVDPRIEWLKCAADIAYFAMTYAYIENATLRQWMIFDLWPAQVSTLRALVSASKLVILKARQLGLSWLCLTYGLWLMLFQAPATVLLFSLKEAEAVELLDRLRKIHQRLPEWMQAKAILRDSTTHLELSNGSRAMAFSTHGGRSYTGSLAIVDEADFTPDLSTFLDAVKPTIDAGGQLFLVSTSDKKRPVSTFKNLFRAALQRTGDYQHIFLPWNVHPGRDAAWYARTRAEMFAQRGTDDDFYAEYPATAEEALAPEQLDRRLPWPWIQACYDADHTQIAHTLPVPNLRIYESPQPGHSYVIGADPAEGNPNSDDSAASVIDADTWAEVAALAGHWEPTVFAGYIDQVGQHYNAADVMPERNNHGHTLIAALRDSGHLRILNGHDDRPGWLTNIKGKPILYDATAEALRTQSARIRDSETASQLASIEASTLSAPQGLHDDRATAYALAIVALARGAGAAKTSTAVAPADPLQEYDRNRY